MTGGVTAGGAVGVTAFDLAALPVPSALTAETVKLYDQSLRSPPIVHDVAPLGAVHDLKPDVAATT